MDHKNHGEILTPVGHLFITHPARRFAPITVRQDWNAVRQELEQVSDSVGIRTMFRHNVQDGGGGGN
jgi:gentisate 1,2-dioxygenase